MIRFIFDLDGTVSTEETLPVIAAHFHIEEEMGRLTAETRGGKHPLYGQLHQTGAYAVPAPGFGNQYSAGAGAVYSPTFPPSSQPTENTVSLLPAPLTAGWKNAFPH